MTYEKLERVRVRETRDEMADEAAAEARTRARIYNKAKDLRFDLEKKGGKPR